MPKGKAAEPVILVFGEGGAGGGRHSHDAAAIKSLIPALRSPDNPIDAGNIKVLKDPISLTRSASPEKVATWFEEIAAQVRDQEAIRPVRAVLVHQDCDGPDGEKRWREFQGELELLKSRFDATRPSSKKASKKGLPVHQPWPIFGVVPVQMTEAWWLLFPECVRGLKPVAWRDLDLPTVNPESHRDAAKVLMEASKRAGGAVNEYKKSESPQIAKLVGDFIRDNFDSRACGQLGRRLPSWSRFIDTVDAL